MAIEYLTLPQIAARIGVTRRTIQEYAATILPAEDGTIGAVRIWLPSTLDLWETLRPGKTWSGKQGEWLFWMPGREKVAYLEMPGIAARLGLSENTIKSYRKKGRFAPPDATTGTLNGWLPQTVDDWNARRPGKRPGAADAKWWLPKGSLRTSTGNPADPESAGAELDETVKTAARRTVCHHATDTGDAALLLDMLGLTGTPARRRSTAATEPAS